MLPNPSARAIRLAFVCTSDSNTLLFCCYRRLSTLGAIGEGDKAKKNKGHNPHKASKGSISISGLSLPLKREFVQMLKEGGDDSVHYFLVLVKHR